MDPCLRMDGEPVKSLWIRRQTSMDDVVMVICYRLLQQEKKKQISPSYNMRKCIFIWFFSSWDTFNYLDISW